MAVNRIILHTGIPKTGSSSIQETLVNAKSKLEKYNFTYFDTGFINKYDHNQILVNLFSVSPQATYDPNLISNFNEEDIARENKITKKKILEYAESKSTDTLIFSAEDLAFLKLNSVKNIKSFFDTYFPNTKLTIITYVRNPIDLIKSTFQQYTTMTKFSKKRIERGLLALAEKTYRTWVKPYTTVFKDNIFVYSFENALASEHGIVGHFLKSIGYPESEIEHIPLFKTNEARCQEVVDFLFALAENIPLFIEESHNQFTPNPLRLVGDTAPLMEITGGKFLLDKDYEKRIYEVVKDDVLWLKDTTGIDYSSSLNQNRQVIDTNTYNFKTITEFKKAFELFSPVLQEFFLKYFQDLYEKTGNENLKALFSEKSFPYLLTQTASFRDYFINKEIKNNRMANPPTKQGWGTDYAQLFISQNQKFVGQNSHIFFRKLDLEDVTVVSLAFEKSKEIKAFRIDPSFYSCVCTIKKLLVNGKENNYKLSHSNADDVFQNTFLFFRDDPWICFSCEEVIESLDIELITNNGSFTYSRFNTAWTACLVENKEHLQASLQNELECKQQLEQSLHDEVEHRQQLEQSLQGELEHRQQLEQSLQSEIEHRQQLEQSLQSKIEHRQQLQNELQNEQSNHHQTVLYFEEIVNRKNMEQNALLSSTSWKITKPLRFISRFIKKLFRKP